MRGLIYKFIAFVSAPIYTRKLSNLLNSALEHDHLYVIDIDNTLANTWPTLKQRSKYRNEFDRYSRLPILENMVNHVKELISRPRNLILYLTARHPVFHKTTKNWLRSHGLYNDSTELIVVVKANEKIAYLEELTKLKCPVTYIDDLSYHHETGEVKFHTSVISKVKEMNLEYLGVDFIQEIQGSAYD